MFIVHRDGMINMIPMDVNEKTFSPVLEIVCCK